MDNGTKSFNLFVCRGCKNNSGGVCGLCATSVLTISTNPGLCDRGILKTEVEITPTILSVPRDQWPEKVQLIAALAKPGEKGVGTVVARLIATNESRLAAAAVIAEEFGVLTTIAGAFLWVMGKDCGCGCRAERMDEMYPIPQDGEIGLV